MAARTSAVRFVLHVARGPQQAAAHAGVAGGGGAEPTEPVAQRVAHGQGEGVLRGGRLHRQGIIALYPCATVPLCYGMCPAAPLVARPPTFNDPLTPGGCLPDPV
eukprot:6446015-Pyramimonas_sp.AAC.1